MTILINNQSVVTTTKQYKQNKSAWEREGRGRESNRGVKQKLYDETFNIQKYCIALYNIGWGFSHKNVFGGF